MSRPTAFDRYIGIDYSGAKAPTSSLKGLRVYMAAQSGPPLEVQPSSSPRWYWTRREIAEWLVERLSEEQRTLVGIDHGFSFPLRYFDKYQLAHDRPAFLDDFQRHWPTDDQTTHTRTLTSSAMAFLATVQLDVARRDGGASRKKGREQNPFFISTYRVRSQSPPMPVSLGCVLSACKRRRHTFGLSMAGTSPPSVPSWPRSTHRCGEEALRWRIAAMISRTPSP